jgi:hypothetical protein
MIDLFGPTQKRRALLVAVAVAAGFDSASLRAEVLRPAGSASAIGELNEPKKLPPEEIEIRGRKLRAELDKALDKVPDIGAAGDLTAIILPYIPSGLAFEDAEGILRAAGFIEPSRPGTGKERDRDREKVRYAVVVDIPQFSRRVFGHIETYALLDPEGLAASVGRRSRMIYYRAR